jgi:hypothetical protein
MTVTPWCSTLLSRTTRRRSAINLLASACLARGNNDVHCRRTQAHLPRWRRAKGRSDDLAFCVQRREAKCCNGRHLLPWQRSFVRQIDRAEPARSTPFLWPVPWGLAPKVRYLHAAFLPIEMKLRPTTLYQSLLSPSDRKVPIRLLECDVRGARPR